MTSPLVYQWHDGAMHPVGRFARIAHQQYEPEQTYFLGEIEERSEISHNHQFAWLKDAWRSLPESLGDEYPSAEHLRKRALIATGWRHVRDYPCATRAEAERLRVTLRAELDDYTVVIAQNAVVRVMRAKSQSRTKMNAADFQKSKQDILDWIAGLLEVSPASLEHAGGI